MKELLHRLIKTFQRHWQWWVQGSVLLALLYVGVVSWINLNQNLAQRNFGLGFDFLWNQAGFAIGETPIAFAPTDLYWNALVIGLLNTFRVISVGLILATIIGVIAGLARLSENWLIHRLALVYVEIFRNTPLLLQLLFWYSAFFLSLPSITEPVQIAGSVFLSQQGVVIPFVAPTESFIVGAAAWGFGTMAAIAVALWLRHRRLSQGSLPLGLKALPGLVWILGGAIALALSGGELPIRWDWPEWTAGEGVIQGLRLSAEYSTLLIGLSFYTASFIAEIVRAGIVAVPRGQTEAARSLGLRPVQMMAYVILPQALRIIIPPLTSQYLNLAKNSSLAIAIGYSDLYAIASPTLNQTGRPVEVILILMGVYLTISLTISALMALLNRTTQWGQAQ